MLIQRLGILHLSEDSCRFLAQHVYCAGFAMLLILSEVFSSNIQSTLPTLSTLFRVGLTGCGVLLLLAKCVFLTRYETKAQWGLLAAVIGYTGFAALYGDDHWFLLAALVGLGAKDVDLRQAVKVFLAVTAAGLVLVQLLHYTTPLVPFK